MSLVFFFPFCRESDSLETRMDAGSRRRRRRNNGYFYNADARHRRRGRIGTDDRSGTLLLRSSVSSGTSRYIRYQLCRAFLHFRHDHDISALNISRYRYQADISRRRQLNSDICPWQNLQRGSIKFSVCLSINYLVEQQQ